MKIRLFILMLALLPEFVVAGEKLCDLAITGEWIREAPPTAEVLAAYMSLENRGRDACKIKQAKSPMFGSIEIHRTIMDNGMARMVMQPGLEIEAGKTVVAEPGGLHFMLMQPKRTVRAGERIPLNLILDNNRTIGLFVPVRKANP